MAFELPALQYSFDSLEKSIDSKTMEIHYTKHHQAYLDKLNSALEKHPEISDKTVEELLVNLQSIPDDIREVVRNNGGGYYNHNFFWNNISPNGGKQIDGNLSNEIVNSFGSFDKFKEEFVQKAVSHFGSGWVWLTLEDMDLHICTTPNQDSPIMKGNTPIIGLDIWEHAYYLRYQNKRIDYVNNWWDIVNWEFAEKNYESGIVK